MELSYEIIIKTLPEGVIAQQVNLIKSGKYIGETVRETLLCQMINTQEEQVRNALIQLGWTPPQEKL